MTRCAPISGKGQTDALQVVVPDAGATTAAQQAAYAARLSLLPDVASVDSFSGIYVKGTHHAAPPGYLAQFQQGRRGLVLGRPHG